MFRRIILFLSLILFLPAMLYAATVQLPETGQTTCYDSVGNIIACAGTGQDGEFRAGATWPIPRFVDNSDQTITDQLTGLIWTKDANAPGPASCTPGITKTLQEALDYVACLNNNSYLGSTDWRLPNKIELGSLVNDEQADLAYWMNTQGFSNVQANAYWSSTFLIAFPSWVWVIRFDDGWEGPGGQTFNNHVWPVRTGQPGLVQLPKTGQTACYSGSWPIPCAGTGQDGEIQAGTTWPIPRFVDNGDQTITDHLTGLMWSKGGDTPGPEACSPGSLKSWQGALDHITCLNDNSYLGFTDWRLPNKKELRSLINSQQVNNVSWLISQGFNLNVFASTYYGYWSAGTYVIGPDCAWFSKMDGIVGDYVHVGTAGTWKQEGYYAWPVRAGGSSTLTVTKTSTGTGTVTTDSGSLVWDNITGTAKYPVDTVVTLTSIPDAGSTFAGWSGGGCSGTGDCTVTLGANTSVTATFDVASYTVTPSTGANGSLSPSTAQAANYSQTASFTITPDAGYLIDSVSGCGGSLSSNTYITGPITSDCTVTASFVQLYTLTLSISGNGTGAVRSLPAPDINCTIGTCGQGYGSGTVVTLTATPDSGATFDRWSGACSSSGVTCQVTMDTAKSVDARFKK